MATNYKRVNLDGKSITETRIASEDLRPGTFVFINDDDEFQQAITPTGRLYVVNAAHDQGLGIGDVIPEGESVTADYVEESREFYVLAVPGTYRKDDPIAVNINGRAEIGSGNIVGYSQDTVILNEEKFLRIRSLSVGLGGGGGGLTPEQESKLNGIQPEATKNQSDTYLLDRTNHTGSQPISSVSGLSAGLDSKVDKIAGYGLSQTNYTQAEKDKLAGLESSRFKGQYASLAALQAAHPTASAGDYANVDEGAGVDVQRYVWDTSDTAWIRQLGSSSQLTAAQIKQEYESNPDTNAFSDAEKQKLSTVAENANNYQHPETHPASMIQQDTSHRFVTDAEKTDWNSKETPSGAQAKATAALTAASEHTDQLQAALEQKSPSILVVDQLRRAVESESGGKQTVIYTAKSQPCIMNVIPRFLMEDLPGWDTADGTGTHPAFIFNGVVESEIFIAAYQASEVAGEAISQPMAYPRTDINYDQARALCQANGPGWDMMSNWDWAAIAMWCMANGFQPRGNTNSGRHHDSRHETGRVPAGATIGSDATGITNTLTGSGPNTWRHDNSPSGISDLVGNVWEWQTGFKLVDGVAHIAPDNGTYTEAQYTNTGFSPAFVNPWSSVSATDAPVILKQGLIVPSSAPSPSGWSGANTEGGRLPIRGGSRDSGGAAGLAALHLLNVRTVAVSNLGFRPRFRNP